MSDGLKLISSVIATGAAATLLSLQPGLLLDDEAAVYDFVRSHYRTYRELPSAQTIQSEVGVRLPTAVESLQYYVDIVHDRYQYNQIRDQFAELREGLSQRNMATISETVQGMSRVLRRSRQNGSVAGTAINIQDGLRLVLDRLTEIRGTGGVSGVCTGWDRYDTITGGYQKGDLITQVGRMGLGKTYIALRQAQQAHLAGESVLFVTTEMAAEHIARRWAALTIGVNPLLLKNGNISTYIERRLRALITGVQSAERFKLFSVGMKSNVSAIEALIQEFGPTFVVIDGVYLLKPTDLQRNMSQRDKVTAVYDELKGLALEADLPFLLTTQFNRQAGKGGREGTLETIGFSDAIGTHSSIVVAVKDGPTEDPKASRTFDFLKGREGESGEVAINFKFAPVNMNEMTPEERESEGDTTDASVEWMGVRSRSTA